MFLDDILIQKKLIGGFLLIVLFMVIVSAVGYLFISSLDQKGDEIYNDRLLPISQFGIIESGLYSIRGDVYKSVLVPEEKERSLTRIDEATVQIIENTDLYGSSYMLPEEKIAFDTFLAAWENYQNELKPVISAIKTDNINEVMERIAAGTSLSDARVEMDTAIATLREINQNQASKLKIEQDAEADFSKSFMIILSVIAAIVAIAFGYILSQSITRPLGRTVEMIQEMGRGHLGMRLNLTRKDEIGQMSGVLDTLCHDLQVYAIGKMQDIAEGKRTEKLPMRDDRDEIAKAVNQAIGSLEGLLEEIMNLTKASASGDLQHRGDVSAFQYGYRDIIDGINNTLEAVVIPVQEAMRLSGSYAEGNYVDRFNQDIVVAGDFIPFRDALNRIGTDGSSAIGGVKKEIEMLSSGMEETNASVEEVASSTNQIASNSNNVSEMAEKSSEGINQVLNAMDDLSTTVASVAAKAEHVSLLTRNATDLSAKGTELARKAEQGMDSIIKSFAGTESIVTDIGGQMNEIGKIIDVISDIAEQTSLLALNAAIEAARAGDAGLGFAVVADEVKALALESQKSAENIAGIIGNLQKKSADVTVAMKNSTHEVQDGNEAVSQTLEVFTQIVRSIDEIGSNMGEVAGASEEQAAAVEEITASVNEVGELMKETMQQAVDSAAATEEVSASVDQISRIISDAAGSVERIARDMSSFTV